MELFLLLPDLQSISFFYKKFLSFKNESKTGFEKQEIELSKQEMKLFLHLPDLQSKTYYTKVLSLELSKQEM